MAPIPPFVWQLVRILAPMASQAITRRLLASPLFYQLVSRTLHEFDHLPKRLNGQKVPPWIGTNPEAGSISDQARDAWVGKSEDVGEPHDMPSPFPPSRPEPAPSQPPPPPPPPPKSSASSRATRQATSSSTASTSENGQASAPRSKDAQEEWRELQEKLQELRRGGKI